MTAAFRIITADERLAEQRGIKGVLTGISGIGKTSQLWTLDASRTLFLNLEAGELAVQGWAGDEVRIRDWELARDIACWVGGPNPAMRADQTFSTAHYERVCTAFGDPKVLARYDTLFVDSIVNRHARMTPCRHGVIAGNTLIMLISSRARGGQLDADRGSNADAGTQR